MSFSSRSLSYVITVLWEVRKLTNARLSFSPRGLKDIARVEG